jgi:hypothetical protein
MKLRAGLSLTLFAAFVVLSLGRFVPSFREATRSLSIAPVIGTLSCVLLVFLSNGMTAYQLWTGKASAWDWKSPENGYQGWISRSDHPYSYWFRVALWLAITLLVDAVLAMAIIRF